jgi:hypothetical protein
MPSQASWQRLWYKYSALASKSWSTGSLKTYVTIAIAFLVIYILRRRVNAASRRNRARLARQAAAAAAAAAAANGGVAQLGDIAQHQEQLGGDQVPNNVVAGMFVWPLCIRFLRHPEEMLCVVFCVPNCVSTLCLSNNNKYVYVLLCSYSSYALIDYKQNDTKTSSSSQLSRTDRFLQPRRAPRPTVAVSVRNVCNFHCVRVCCLL